jgi:hypothetical protein
MSTLKSSMVQSFEILKYLKNEYFINTHYCSHQVTLQYYIQGDLQRNLRTPNYNSLFLFSKRKPKTEGRQRYCLDYKTLFFYTQCIQLSCNLHDESGQNTTEGRDKKNAISKSDKKISRKSFGTVLGQWMLQHY